MILSLKIFSNHSSVDSQTRGSCNDVEQEEEGGLGMNDAAHEPVMINEVLSMLNLKEGMVVVDCTTGLGGHAAAMAEKIGPGGRLIGIDKDQESLSIAREKLKNYAGRSTFVHDDFRNLDKILQNYDDFGIDAALFDLGVSSYQLKNPVRGFSLKCEGPLDMRMDRKNFICAYDLLNNLTQDEIASILHRFGEERFSYRIAQCVVKERKHQPISSTKQLADLVTRVLPYKARFRKIHPATRTFQALRIAVNRELDALDAGLKKTALFLNKRGRICVISFHSLEDRIVKRNFQQLAKIGRFRLITKKVLRPSREEAARNPRSRSAKMRVIERVR